MTQCRINNRKTEMMMKYNMTMRHLVHADAMNSTEYSNCRGSQRWQTQKSNNG
jgi:hypothetical protein